MVAVVEPVVVLILYVCLALLWGWPLPEMWTAGMPGARMDPLQQAWSMSWTWHALSTGVPFWDANIYHPSPHSLAYSDHLLGEFPLFALALSLGAGPIAAYNTAWVGCVALSAWGAWWLARDLVPQSCVAPLLAGVVFGFFPAHLTQIDHLNFMCTAGFPLAILCWLRAEQAATRGRRFAWSVGFCAALVWQCLCSTYLTVYVFFVFPVLALVTAWRVRDWKKLLLPGVVLLVSGLAMLPILWPYLTVKQTIGHVAGAHPNWGAGLFSYFTAPPGDRLWGWTATLLGRDLNLETMLFPGLTALVLAFIGLRRAALEPPSSLPAPSRWRRTLRALNVIAVLLGLWAGFIALSGGLELQLGHIRVLARHSSTPTSALVIILVLRCVLDTGLRGRLADWLRRVPLPVALCAVMGVLGVVFSFYGPAVLLGRLYFPWASLRAPARFSVFVQLAVAMLGAYGVGALASRGRLVALVVVLAFVEGLGIPMAIDNVPSEFGNVPGPVELEGTTGDIYRWIAAQPPEMVLAELPSPNSMFDEFYEYASTMHFRSLANGSSGFAPHYWNSVHELMQSFPQKACLQTLALLGVTHVVVHASRWPRFSSTARAPAAAGPPPWDEVSRAIAAESLLEPVTQIGTDRVYRLRPEARTVLGAEDNADGLVEIPRDGWSVQVSTDPHPLGSSRWMLDGDPRTAWATGRSQQKDDSVTVDMGRAQALDAVILELGGGGSDYPRRWRVETSDDGTNWQTARRGAFQVPPLEAYFREPLDPHLVLRLPPGPPHRWFRVTLEEDNPAFWVIAEIRAAHRG